MIVNADRNENCCGRLDALETASDLTVGGSAHETSGASLAQAPVSSVAKPREAERRHPPSGGPRDQRNAEIRGQWPDGDWSPAYRVFASQFVVLDRTKPQAAYWYPGR
jgi:hypothetical protein